MKKSLFKKSLPKNLQDYLNPNKKKKKNKKNKKKNKKRKKKRRMRKKRRKREKRNSLKINLLYLFTL
jgi:hypothetical protein